MTDEPQIIVYAVDDFASIARRLAELRREEEQNQRSVERAKAMLDESQKVGT